MKNDYKKLNSGSSIRFKECLKSAGLNQKQLAKLTNYSEQHISSFATGKKAITIPAAMAFSKIFKVSPEYLLCESDSKTADEREKKEENYEKLFGKYLNGILYLAGYKIVCQFISNWKELGLDELYAKTNSPKVSSMQFLIDSIANRLIPGELYSKIRLSYEVIAPNGKRFYCTEQELSELSEELIEYVSFRMEQLEKRYCNRVRKGEIVPKVPESTNLTFSPVYPPVSKPEGTPYCLSSLTHKDKNFPDSRFLEK